MIEISLKAQGKIFEIIEISRSMQSELYCTDFPETIAHTNHRLLTRRKDVASMKLLAKYNIDYDWKTICVGYESGILFKNAVIKYANEQLIKSHVEDWILELAYDSDNLSFYDILNLIKDNTGFTLTENTKEWRDEYRKIRLSKILHIQDTSASQNQLLERLALLYADTGYPKDMESFVYYMPPSNHRSLIENYNSFLESEENYIASLQPKLP